MVSIATYDVREWEPSWVDTLDDCVMHQRRYPRSDGPHDKLRNATEPYPSSCIRSECRKSLFHDVCLMTTATGEGDT